VRSIHQARRGEEIAFIVYHQMLIAADAQFAHGDGKASARGIMRQRAGVVGEGFNIEKDGAGTAPSISALRSRCSCPGAIPRR
jgi:hypothetical protein